MNILDGLDVRIACSTAFSNFMADYGDKIKSYNTIKNREEDISGMSCELYNIIYYYAAFTVGNLIKVEMLNTGETSYDYYDAIYDLEALAHNLSCMDIDFEDIKDNFNIIFDPVTPITTMLRYFGTNENIITLEAEVEALPSDRDDKLDKSWSEDASGIAGGKYVYYAFPVSMGEALFYVGGFYNTAWVRTTIGITEGVARDPVNYYVYRSVYKQHGSAILLQAVTK